MLLVLASAMGTGLTLCPRLCSARPARDLARAKALFRRAEVHFSVGEFKKALDLYAEAYKVKPLPAFLFNIAQCHRYLGQHKRAVFFYERFLAQSPGTPHELQVRGFIEECQAALKKREEQERIRRRNAAHDEPGLRPEPRSTPGPASAPASGLTSPTKPAAETSRKTTRAGSAVWLWSGVALSGALLVTGAVTGGIAYDKNEEYKDPATPYARQIELRDSGEPLAVASVVTLSLGAAAAVGTALYYWLAYRRAEQPAVSLLLPRAPAGSSGALLSAGWTF